MHGNFSSTNPGEQVGSARPLAPDASAISSFLYALFTPSFVHHYPDAWIEIVCIKPDGAIKYRFVSPYDLKAATEYIVSMNVGGYNCYVGAALRQGEQPEKGRGTKKHFCAARMSWIDCDKAGDCERAAAICQRESLQPALIVGTGTTPHWRGQLYFLNAEALTDAKDCEDSNTALRDLFDSDKVQNCDRILRIGGTINYPTKDKRSRGYVTELTAVEIKGDPPSYTVEALCNLRPEQSHAKDRIKSTDAGGPAKYDDPFEGYSDERRREEGRLTDRDIEAILKKHAAGAGSGWHDDLLAVTWELLCRGYDPLGIQMVIGSACKKGFDDPTSAGSSTRNGKSSRPRSAKPSATDRRSPPPRRRRQPRWR